MYRHIIADTVGEGIEASMKELLTYGIAQERENQDRKEEASPTHPLYCGR